MIQCFGLPCSTKIGNDWARNMFTTLLISSCTKARRALRREELSNERAPCDDGKVVYL